MRTLLLVSSCCLLLASSSMAAPLVYVEGPDLTSNLAIPTALGALDLGTNSVTGTINSNYGNSGPCFGSGDTADAFSFQVPAGMQVTSISLVVTNWVAPSGWTSRVRNFSGGTSVQRFGNNVTYNNLINVGSLGAGTYDLQVHQEPREDENFDCEGGTQSLSYQFTLEVGVFVAVEEKSWGLVKRLYD